MARALRIQEEGAAYHVLSRGNLKQDILEQDSQKAYFLKLLRTGAERYRIHIFAYCLMDNHYHLSLRISTENLPEFMHYLGSSYANYLVRGGWVGHVFSGRYKAIRIDEEEYFLIVNRYIHLNPVKAGTAGMPEEYAWSNYNGCVNGGNKGWLEEDWLTEYFGADLGEARKEYRRFVEEAMGGGSYYPENRVVAQALLGSDEFVKRITTSLRITEWTKEVTGKRLLMKIASLDEISHAVCEHLGINCLEQGDYGRDEEYRYACWLMMRMAREYAAASCKDIAEVLGGIKENAVSHRFGGMRKSLRESSGLQGRLEADEKRVLEIIEG